MSLADYDFDLPPEQIARFPVEPRDRSRLMVLSRQGNRLEHRTFADLPELLLPGDLLVVNNSRVLPARLFCKKVATHGRVELLLVEPLDEPTRWRVMLKGAKSIKKGVVLCLVDAPEVLFEVEADEGEGFFCLALPEDGRHLAERYGEIPLPPYLGREAEPQDHETYQTIFAKQERTGSVAAPTAGLHFSSQVLDRLEQRGVLRTELTLHVGPGTFLPIRGDSIEAHQMHRESYSISEEAAFELNRAKNEGRRRVAVGTTVVRTLESVGSPVLAGPGTTRIFIRPGHVFSAVDALLTNFHLPRSTLLLLVAAFAGRERILDAYAEAQHAGYRFFSYGDAMLID